MARNAQLHDELNTVVLERYSKWKKRQHSFKDFDIETINEIYNLLHEVDPAVYDAATEVVLPQAVEHVYVYTIQLAKKLKKQGYVLLAISGSRDIEAEYFARHHGFDDWVGREHKRSADGKKFTGEHVLTFKDKHLTLEKMVKRHDLTYEGSFAVGDTAGDIEMLEKVENPIAFNPNDDLLAHAKEKGWKIVVERKSIAFELELDSNGSYRLVD